MLRNKGMWRSVHFSLLQRLFRNVAHACACCANGEASLRGMCQATFLKANGKFLLMWESPTLSQAKEKLETGIKYERKTPAKWFLLCVEQEELKVEVWIPPDRLDTAGHGIIVISQLQGTIFRLPCTNRCCGVFYTHNLLLVLLIQPSISFSASAEVT